MKVANQVLEQRRSAIRDPKETDGAMRDPNSRTLNTWLGFVGSKQIKDFRNLDVWNAAKDLATAVYLETRAFPRSELFGLTAQMRRAPPCRLLLTSMKAVSARATLNSLGSSATREDPRRSLQPRL
jgi:23S rRNA-intervening sequence protein